MRVAAASLLTLVALSVSPVFAAQVEVTQCGQTVEGSGVLVADLDCASVTTSGIDLSGRLDLNGHTITAGPGRFAIHCLTNCTIKGPGTITGPTSAGILVRRTGLLKNVTITNMAIAIKADTIDGRGKVRLKSSTISDTTEGIIANVRVSMIDSAVTNASYYGIAVGKNALRTDVGCTKGAIDMKRSSVTGSGTDPGCGVDRNCADLITCGNKPRVGNGSTCGTSCQGGSPVPCPSWGVCTSD